MDEEAWRGASWAARKAINHGRHAGPTIGVGEAEDNVGRAALLLDEIEAFQVAIDKADLGEGGDKLGAFGRGADEGSELVVGVRGCEDVDGVATNVARGTGAEVFVSIISLYAQ